MIQLNVCIGSACHMQGTYNMLSIFQQLIEEHNLHDKVDLKAMFCMGRCAEEGISVRINDEEPTKVTGSEARKYFNEVIIPLID